eukprot:1154345-Pelagomonas_calceolata.AAC.3
MSAHCTQKVVYAHKCASGIGSNLKKLTRGHQLSRRPACNRIQRLADRELLIKLRIECTGHSPTKWSGSMMANSKAMPATTRHLQKPRPGRGHGRTDSVVHKYCTCTHRTVYPVYSLDLDEHDAWVSQVSSHSSIHAQDDLLGYASEPTRGPCHLWLASLKRAIALFRAKFPVLFSHARTRQMCCKAHTCLKAKVSHEPPRN